ncbi:MAG TPA: TonB family protein [Candidatus Obscuribacterales bacterium]
MTLRSSAHLLAALCFLAGTMPPGAEACEPALAMAPVAALTFTIPAPNVPPRTPKVVPTSMPRSMPVKHRARTTAQPPATAPQSAPSQVDYRPYMKDLEKRIRAAWVRPKNQKFMPVGTTFKILRSGQIKDVKVALSSGDSKVDRAAVNALYLVKAQPLPARAAEYVKVKFVFENNNGSSCCCGGNNCTCASAGACGRSQEF